MVYPSLFVSILYLTIIALGFPSWEDTLFTYGSDIKYVCVCGLIRTNRLLNSCVFDIS